jgi:hypothetical protein
MMPFEVMASSVFCAARKAALAAACSPFVTAVNAFFTVLRMLDLSAIFWTRVRLFCRILFLACGELAT